MGFFSALGAIGSVLGGIGSIVGGSKSASSAKSINAMQMELAREQFDFQKDYVKNRLQWQVEDAQKAGLHPMVAAGLSSASFSPVSANLSPIEYDWVGQAGQSLAYAATKSKTNKQQEQAFQFQQQLGEEQLNGVRLDNELKVMQILGMVSQLNQTGPAAPDLNGGKNLIGGQNDSPSYSITHPYGKNLYTLFSVARHGDTLAEVPHPDIADSITESEWKNIAAHIDAEIQAGTGVIKPPLYLLSPSERESVRKHRYELVRIPGIGWKLDRNPSRPHPLDKLSKYEKFKRKNTQRWNGKQSVVGKIF